MSSSSSTEKVSTNANAGDETTTSSSPSAAKENRKISLPALTTNGPGSSFDLPGKLIVKAQLYDDIRRVPIHNDEITYDELLLMMQRIFKGSLKAQDDIVVKYQDEDGDLVTIFDSNDLSLAIQSCRILKLKLLPTKKEEPAKELKVAAIPVSAIRDQLKELRDKVNNILDYLDQNDLDKVLARDTKSSVSTTSQTVEKIATVNMNGTGSSNEMKPATVFLPDENRPASSPVPVNEFDPLGQPTVQPKQFGKGIDPMQSSSSAVNGGAVTSGQLSQQPQQQITSSNQSTDHLQGVMQGQVPHQQPQTSQANRYAPTVQSPLPQSLPSVNASTGGVTMSHGGVAHTQLQQSHSQPSTYPGTAPTPPYAYQQQQQPYGTGASIPAQTYPPVGHAVPSYNSAPKTSRPTGPSYPTGNDSSSSAGYPQMPPTSSMMPMSGHNPSGVGSAPSMQQQQQQQQFPPPPQQQQYNSGMPPAMPSYRPAGPPPPVVGGGVGSSNNPYSRSAVPPPPVQTYRPM